MSPLSLRPSTFVEGGGLLDDVDVTVKQSVFAFYDYNGTVSPPSPSLGLTLVDPDGKEHDQFFSAGDAKYFSPSADDKNPSDIGKYLVAVGDKTAVNNNTNLAKFIASLVNAGFPEDKLESGDISILEGLEFHLKREAVKRTGLVRTGKNAGREQTVITVAKIIRLPWEKGASTSKAASSAKPTNGAAPADDISTKAGEVLLEVLMENDGKLPKAKVSTAAFGKLKGDPNQKAISQLLFKDDFIKSVDGVKLEGGVVSME